MIRLISKNPIRFLPALSARSARICSRYKSDGFTYLFPDVPNEDETTNYLLNIPKQGEVINFHKVEPYKSFRAVLKTLFELEGCFEELNAIDLGNLESQLTFDGVYNEVDRKMAHLNYAFTTFDLMFNFHPQKFLLRKTGNVELLNAHNEIKISAFRSKTIFKIMLELDKQGDKLTAHQRKVVQKYITEGKLTGLHIDKDAAIEQIRKSIVTYEGIFIDNLNSYSKNFIQKVINADYVKTVPANLRSMVEGKSKVNLFFSPAVYQHFLSNCNDQQARYEYWRAYNSRASLATVPERGMANNLIVDEIIFARRKLADHLGFVNYIEYCLQSRTLDSIVAIKELIEKLFEQTRNVFNQDLNDILNFAVTDPDYKSKFLQLWDLPYFRNQLQKRTMSSVDAKLDHYFPMRKVVDGLFKFLSDNLNIKIEKVQDKELNENHPLGDTLEYYKLYHNGRFMGNFYLNLFAEVRSPQFRNITDRCLQLGVTPICGLFLNYQKPVEGQKMTMSLGEVISLFRSFGFVLNHLLPTNPYAELSGQNSINYDFRDLTANLMMLFALHDYDVIKECSQHVQTNEQLPEDLHKKYVESFLKYRSINLTEEIYRSALDFALYTQVDASIDICREIFNKYMYPFNFENETYHLCSDVGLMCSGNAGSIYCGLLSQVLAADLFMLTQESQGNNQSRFDLLNAYANHFLLNEQGSNDLEAFRKIRGRDYSLKPFLTLNQYTSTQQQLSSDRMKAAS